VVYVVGTVVDTLNEVLWSHLLGHIYCETATHLLNSH
jgi:hypothetical protein